MIKEVVIEGVLVEIQQAGTNFCASAPGLVGCIATADTEKETVKNMRVAIRLHKSSDKGFPPTPSGEDRLQPPETPLESDQPDQGLWC